MKVNGEKILKVTLLVGGIPPALSGFFAMFFPDLYFDFIGPLVGEAVQGKVYGLIFVIGSLQGGDAFVAGMSRIFVSYSKHSRLMVAFGFVGIFHSIFELWLLPQKLITWCEEEGLCSQVFQYEVWGFVFLHVLLLLGFSIGCWQTLKNCKRATAIS